MDPVNEEVSPDATMTGLERKKRGRPKKDPSERRARKAHSQAAASMPPGFPEPTNKPPRVDPINNPNESMVGQIVTGVVQATFDAGYLLAVRIGNSKITLTGAVFKPGHTAPVTPENDVAPHVEMIKRTEIPFPTDVQPKRRRKRRSKEKNMQVVTYAGNGPDPAVPQVGARGNMVPVALQPINLSNGISTNQPPPHLRALQGKPVHSVLPLSVYPPNGPTGPASHSQTSSQFTVTPTGSGNENASFKHAEGVNMVKSSVVQDQVVKSESDMGDMNEPLFVEPLQTRHTIHHVLGGVMHGGTGSMTDLLQAVQQNVGNGQISRNGHPTASYNGTR